MYNCIQESAKKIQHFFPTVAVGALYKLFTYNNVVAFANPKKVDTNLYEFISK